MAARVQIHRGSAAILHDLDFPADPQPQVWRMEPSRTALVMGSGQSRELFDGEALARAGVELAGRRSGGGAVWVDPAVTVWVDVLAPRGSPLHSEDLTTTFLRVGRVWQRAFAALGVHLDLARVAPKDPMARWVCWAGIGWGELFQPGHLTAAAGGTGPVGKVVGLSQRRTRWGARVQGLAVVDGSAGRAGDWFVAADAPGPPEIDRRIGVAGALDVDRDRLTDEVVERLRIAASA